MEVRDLILPEFAPAASWFCEYMEWEDKNIINNGV